MNPRPLHRGGLPGTSKWFYVGWRPPRPPSWRAPHTPLWLKYRCISSQLQILRPLDLFMMIWERIEICAEVSWRSRVYVGGLGRQLLRAFNASKRSSRCKIGQYTLGPSNRCVRPAARSRPSLRAMAIVTSMVKREQIAVRAASSCTRSDIHACVHCSLYSMYFDAKTDLKPLRGVPELRVRAQ